MGCGNSSQTTSSGGRAESSSKVSDEQMLEDDKRKNYGGVYVGLPTDLSSIPQVQMGPLKGATEEQVSRRSPAGVLPVRPLCFSGSHSASSANTSVSVKTCPASQVASLFL